MSHIFISYASANRPFALQVAERLEQFYDIWIDREGIEGGMQWEQAIMEAVTDCAIFVVIVTPASNQSEWVARETILAEKLKKQRIPILADGELPFRLLNLHYIDFQGEFEGGFRDLLEALKPYLQPQDKTRDAVNQLLGEAVRAQLAGDTPTARNLVGQALTIQPDLSATVETFWQELSHVPQQAHAESVQRIIDSGQHIIIEQVRYFTEKQYEDRTAYVWKLYLDLPEDILNQIESVHYELHPTFKNPNAIVRDRKSHFRLKFVGWGTFDVGVTIYFNDGSYITTEHALSFPES